jgi:hypothetical protein
MARSHRLGGCKLRAQNHGSLCGGPLTTSELSLVLSSFGGRWLPASHLVGFKLQAAWSFRIDMGHIGSRDECTFDHVGG